MRWIKKKWARYTMLAMFALQVGIIEMLDKYGLQMTTILLWILAYCLFILIFLWIYYKYPEKFRD